MQAGAWDEAYEQIKARELATLDSLVNGAALGVGGGVTTGVGQFEGQDRR